MKRLAAFFLLLVLISAGAQERNEPCDAYTVIADVQYCTGSGKPLLMDISIPRKRLHPLTPPVLWLHGGGWERGDKLAARDLSSLRRPDS